MVSIFPGTGCNAPGFSSHRKDRRNFPAGGYVVTSPVAFDEWYGLGDTPRAMVRDIDLWLKNLPVKELSGKRNEADVLFRRLGITFVVYGREGGTE